LTAGTYKFVEPSADYDLEEMLSQAKTGRLQLENDLAQFRSDVSIWQLRDFFTKHNFLLSFSYIMLAIAAFSNWVFPLIPLKVGGGEILPITVYISKADSLSGTVHGGLLDESDQGYFLLPSGQAKGIFIPKERVEAIYFTNGPSDLHELTK